MFYDLTYREVEEKYRDHGNTAGLIEFPEGWKIKIIPPFGGAMGRFRVYNKDESESVSVYMDCYDCLGCMGMRPYWEMYPTIDDDCARFLMGEEAMLINEIKRTFGEL